jgi:hypothetical protein
MRFRHCRSIELASVKIGGVSVSFAPGVTIVTDGGVQSATWKIEV